MSASMARRKQEHPQPLRNQLDEERADHAIGLAGGKGLVFRIVWMGAEFGLGAYHLATSGFVIMVGQSWMDR